MYSIRNQSKVTTQLSWKHSVWHYGTCHDFKKTKVCRI